MRVDLFSIDEFSPGDVIGNRHEPTDQAAGGVAANNRR
jgi:hypothetical protein